MLKVLNAGKDYNKVMAVENMDITVNRGKYTALSGPTERGKQLY